LEMVGVICIFLITILELPYRVVAIYRTTDNGINWIRQASIHKSEILEIHYVDENHGWAVGTQGGLYRFSK
jgi:photosystem II stability/assembly factor-like uncharacterized protein